MRSIAPSACQRTQHYRCLSNLTRPIALVASFPRPRPILRTVSPASSAWSPSPLRHHSSLPVQQHYIPRTYPFPVILTTELLLEEDIDLHRSNPHDLPPYKSTLTCNIHDLPLTAAEKRVFRILVGARLYSHTFHPHPVPSFLTHKQTPHLPKHRRQRAKDSAVRVRFVSRHLGSAAANENRVFQLLDECIRQSKVLVSEMAADGQWVEEGEDEAILREATARLREDKRKAKEVGGEQARMIGGESVGRVAERQQVASTGGEIADGHKSQ